MDSHARQNFLTAFYQKELQFALLPGKLPWQGHRLSLPQHHLPTHRTQVEHFQSSFKLMDA